MQSHFGNNGYLLLSSYRHTNILLAGLIGLKGKEKNTVIKHHCTNNQLLTYTAVR